MCLKHAQNNEFIMAQRHSLDKGVISAVTFKLTPVRHHTTMLTGTMVGFNLHLVDSFGSR